MLGPLGVFIAPLFFMGSVSIFPFLLYFLFKTKDQVTEKKDTRGFTEIIEGKIKMLFPKLVSWQWLAEEPELLYNSGQNPQLIVNESKQSSVCFVENSDSGPVVFIENTNKFTASNGTKPIKPKIHKKDSKKDIFVDPSILGSQWAEMHKSEIENELYKALANGEREVVITENLPDDKNVWKGIADALADETTYTEVLETGILVSLKGEI